MRVLKNNTIDSSLNRRPWLVSQAKGNSTQPIHTNYVDLAFENF